MTSVTEISNSVNISKNTRRVAGDTPRRAIETRIAYFEQHGFSFFALKPNEKTPASGWEMFQHRQPSATEKANWIYEQRQNFAIVTGSISNNLVVVDLDPAKMDTDPEQWIQRWPTGYLVSTAAHGYHLGFIAPPGVRVGNTTAKIAPGVDTRGEGGYVVAPGGRVMYRVEEARKKGVPPGFIGEYVMLGNGQPAPMPPDLLALLTVQEPRTPRTSDYTPADADEAQTLAMLAVLPDWFDKYTDWLNICFAVFHGHGKDGVSMIEDRWTCKPGEVLKMWESVEAHESERMAKGLKITTYGTLVHTAKQHGYTRQPDVTNMTQESCSSDAPFPAGIPDSWRSVLMNRKHFPDSCAVGLEHLNTGIASGCITPDGFTAADYVACCELPERTARKVLSVFVKLGFLQLVYREKRLSPHLAKTPGGRPEAIYQVTDVSEWHTLLLKWITPRLYEQIYADALALPTAAMVRDSGTAEDAQAIADELRSDHPPVDKVRLNRAQRELTRIAESLKDKRSTPLPEGWSLDNAKAYRAAYAHKVAGGGYRSRPKLCALLGVGNTALSSVLKDAGIEQVAQYEQVEVLAKPERLVQEIKAARIEGAVVALIAELPDGRVLNRAVVRTADSLIDPDALRFYADVQRQGATVSAQFRVASHQKVVRTEPPLSPMQSISEKPAPEPTPRPAKIDMGEPTPEPRQRHYGSTYDPAWLSLQWWLHLRDKFGWVEQRGTDKLINPDTGETARRDMQPVELLECILGRKVERQPDPLLSFATTGLGARVTVKGLSA